MTLSLDNDTYKLFHDIFISSLIKHSYKVYNDSWNVNVL